METQASNHKKRTKKNHSLSLKLQIIQEIEQGLLTPKRDLLKSIESSFSNMHLVKKHGNFHYQYTSI